METMERKQPRARRSFTPEFKAEIVELCQRGDRSIGVRRPGAGLYRPMVPDVDRVLG